MEKSIDTKPCKYDQLGSLFLLTMATSTLWFSSTNSHVCWLVHCLSWRKEDYTLTNRCQDGLSTRGFVCSTSWCSDQLCHHLRQGGCIDVVTMPGLSLLLYAARMYEVYQPFWATRQLICCHSHPTPGISNQKTTSVHKSPTCD